MLVLLSLALAATTTADLSRIYRAPGDDSRAAVLSSIVFVPGILGSEIRDTTDGRAYWGEVFGQAAKPNRKPADFAKLALPLASTPADVARLDDELDGTAMLHVVTVNTPFGKLQARGYPGVFEGLLDTLIATDPQRARRMSKDRLRAGELPFVAFAYDWRRDLADEAAKLHEAVQIAADRRAAAGGPRRATLVAHSMGALLARYYLRYGPAPLPDDGRVPEPTWAGAQLVDDVLLVGPPNAGSAQVFESLHAGQAVNPLLPRYPPALVATFPSLYQMLPRARHNSVVFEDGSTADLLDLTTWTDHGLGPFAADQLPKLAAILPDATDNARLAALTTHVGACLTRAARLHEALDQPSEPPAHLRIHLFAGDGRNTESTLMLDRTRGKTDWVGREPGDGSVTRRSALLDERAPGAGGRLVSPIHWDTVWFANAEHFGLSRDTEFLDNALYLLLEHPWP